MMERRFDRVRDFFGEGGLKRIRSARVLVAGLGGVGSHCASALARTGVGELVLCDFDRVTETSLNRSALFGPGDVGRGKAEAAAGLLAALCPGTRVGYRTVFIHSDTLPELLPRDCGLIAADAIDSLNPKAELISWCLAQGIPVFSSMGAAGRRNPSMVRVGNLWESRGCPLARQLRRCLAKRNAMGEVECVYSEERPLKPLPPDRDDALTVRGRVRNRLPSLMTVPGVFGYALAQLVIDWIVTGVGGNVWESNPSGVVSAPDAGFEVREGHQSPSAPAHP